MPNPLSNIAEHIPLLGKTAAIGAGLIRGVVGLAHDYWYDGNGELPVTKPVAASAESTAQAQKINAHAPEVPKESLWHALPGEISEKMWGAGYVTPGDIALTEAMISPLGINKDMSMLDLSAGLGGRLRKTAAAFGIYITGLEPDAEIATRGMQLSKDMGQGKKAEIRHYDPANLKLDRKYDCVIARETIYRLANKEKFINDIAACCKPKAQVSFTDYIVNAEVKDAPAIVAWRAFEAGASPIGLAEMTGIWSKAGFNLRVQEDQTEFYRKEVLAGMLRLANFIKTSPKPDDVTKQTLNKRIAVWAHRASAMEAGMKFYRFYGLR